MKPVFFLFFLWLGVANAQQTNTVSGNPSEDDIPSFSYDERFSTNWYMAVQQVLPVGYSLHGKYDFQAATNGLSQASRNGNLTAQALWGFTLIVLRSSPDATETGLKLARDAAEKGNVLAMINLGYLFEIGKYVHRNFNEAFRWFHQAAELGNAEAQLQLGGCYHYGFGNTPDYSMAAKYYRLSANQTNFAAMKSLGYLLMNGYGVQTNEDEAKSWFLRAAKEGGSRRAMYNLGVLYCRKYPDTNAMIESFKWLKQSAELGDALAAYHLASFYYRGWGATETNLASYRLWRFKAAYLGSTEAQYRMGVAYRLGDGVPKDPENSLLWYGKAAAKNHPEALYDLAVHYLEEKTNRASLILANRLMLRAAQMGHREAQLQWAKSCWRGDIMLSCEEGKEWLTRAAEAGWPNAEICLYQLYYYGIQPGKDCPSYPKDKTEAIKWMRRAAEHGNFQMQAMLAVMLIRGLEMDPNKVEAEKLLRSAATHGYAPAQNDLGFAILNGDVLAKDATEAAQWCKLAVINSTDTNVIKRAEFNLARALFRLTADQRQEVDNHVKLFKPVPPPEVDPKITGWENNSDYQKEDGRFGH